MVRQLVKTGLVLGFLMMTPISAARAADVSVTVSVFHDRLAAYGSWVSVNRYGSCWRPRVARTWRPYTVGYWAYTDYGWTWVSDESWGWATYHYGRWVEDPNYGWIWVPDETWGPAYVSWRYGDGWIGWAPLPPGISVSMSVGRDLQPSAYAFVQTQYFGDPGVRAHIVADARNAALIPATQHVARVDPQAVARASGHQVVQLHVRSSSDPRMSHATVSHNQLTVYRPSRASTNATTQPQPRSARSEPTNHSHGTTGHVVTAPQRTEQPQRRTTPERRTTPQQHVTTQQHSAQTAQQAPQKAAPQPRASQPQHGAERRTNQHAASAPHQPAAPQRQAAAPRQQPAPVGTSGHHASKPAAAPKASAGKAHPAPAPKNNSGQQKDKDKKKGGS